MLRYLSNMFLEEFGVMYFIVMLEIIFVYVFYFDL